MLGNSFVLPTLLGFEPKQRADRDSTNKLPSLHLEHLSVLRNSTDDEDKPRITWFLADSVNGMSNLVSNFRWTRLGGDCSPLSSPLPRIFIMD
jgi:hypothetical protein